MKTHHKAGSEAKGVRFSHLHYLSLHGISHLLQPTSIKPIISKASFDNFNLYDEVEELFLPAIECTQG
jgi:hypothetical protein